MRQCSNLSDLFLGFEKQIVSPFDFLGLQLKVLIFLFSDLELIDTRKKKGLRLLFHQKM